MRCDGSNDKHFFFFRFEDYTSEHGDFNDSNNMIISVFEILDFVGSRSVENEIKYRPVSFVGIFFFNTTLCPYQRNTAVINAVKIKENYVDDRDGIIKRIVNRLAGFTRRFLRFDLTFANAKLSNR